MGNDGGTIATQRSYVRGAKLNKTTTKKASSDTAEGREEVLNTCALTGMKLNHGVDSVVACPYGRLYLKEAVIKALLRRAQASTDIQQQIGQYIRGLKDLHDVKFASGCVCPIIGQNLSSGSTSCFLITSKSSKTLPTNVVSEKGLKQMGMSSLQEEYGPFEETDLIYLAPSYNKKKNIQMNLESQRRELKKSKLEKKKRKSQKDNGGKTISIDDSTSRKSAKISNNNKALASMKRLSGTRVALEVNSNSAVSLARASVASAVASDSILSSLFVKDNSTLSEKEKKDKLFITNGR